MMGRRDEEGDFMRVNKYLSEMGICSRREADRLLEAGRVMVDGERAFVGMQVFEGQRVMVDGRYIWPICSRNMTC